MEIGLEARAELFLELQLQKGFWEKIWGTQDNMTLKHFLWEGARKSFESTVDTEGLDCTSPKNQPLSQELDIFKRLEEKSLSHHAFLCLQTGTNKKKWGIRICL